MSDTHNKLQYGNNYRHWKILVLALDLSYFSFSNPNPTHLRKHQTISPNHQVSLSISYVGYYSVRLHMAWSQKFCKSEISLHTGRRSQYATFPGSNLAAHLVPCWTITALGKHLTYNSALLDSTIRYSFVSISTIYDSDDCATNFSVSVRAKRPINLLLPLFPT